MITAPRTVRIARTAVLLGVPAALALGLTAAPANAIAATQVVYAGNAYGSTVSLGNYAHSGKTSDVGICTTNGALTRTNHAAAINVPNVGTIGAVDTSLASSRSGSDSTSTATAQTAGLSLLNGMITADAVSSTAALTYDGSAYSKSGNATLVNLVINGQSQSQSPTVNQTVDIPGLAHIVLNRQYLHTSFGLHSFTTQAMLITVLAGNPLGVAGGKIVISSSTGTLHDPVNSVASGSAYGTTVNAGDGTVTSGKTAFTAVGCGGTDGQTVSNDTAGITVPAVLSTGVISSTSMSSDSGSGSNVTTTATVAGVNVASVISASAISVSAVGTRSPGSAADYSTSSATFTNLVINGMTFPSTVPPNTVVPLGPLGAVGSVTLNTITVGTGGVQCYGAVVTLASGVKVVIAAARARLTGH